MGVEKVLLDGRRYAVMMPTWEISQVKEGDERRESANGAWKRRWKYKGLLLRGLEAIKLWDYVYTRCKFEVDIQRHVVRYW